MELLKPYLSCRNCGERIALPHPSPEGKPTSQTEWPPDSWKRNFLCRQCGHVSVYSAQAVHWEPFLVQAQSPQPKSPDIACFEIRCAKEGCAAPLRVHVVGDDWQQNPMLIAQIARGNFHAVLCEFGHEPHPNWRMGMQPRLDPLWWE